MCIRDRPKKQKACGPRNPTPPWTACRERGPKAEGLRVPERAAPSKAARVLSYQRGRARIALRPSNVMPKGGSGAGTVNTTPGDGDPGSRRLPGSQRPRINTGRAPQPHRVECAGAPPGDPSLGLPDTGAT
eukprot:6772878-Alexandrium_andersonii.AAC.1